MRKETINNEIKMCFVLNYHSHVGRYHYRCLTLGRSEQMTSKKYHTIFKNVNILEFGDNGWNHCEKCTNMPSIGLVINEKALKKFLKNKNTLYIVKLNWFKNVFVFKSLPLSW